VHPLRLAQVALAEVVPVLLLERGPPHERSRAHDLGPGVQHGLVEQVEHVPAHDHRGAAEAAELQRAQGALGLELDVVVEQQQEVGVLALERLGHGAGEAARTADVALLDHPQLLAQPLGDRVEAGLVVHLARALIHQEDAVDALEQRRIVGDVGERAHAVVGLVVGGHAQAQLAGGDGIGVGGPRSALEDQLVGAGLIGAGDEVEPVPAAVAERREGQVEDALGAAPDHTRVDALLHALGVGTVDDDGAGTLRAQGKGDLIDHGPALPVGGGEGVEVAGEGDATAGAHAHAGAREHVVDVRVLAQPHRLSAHRGPGLGVGVERQHIGILGQWENDVLERGRHRRRASLD